MTLFISATDSTAKNRKKNEFRKTVKIYFFVAVSAVIIDNIYALFGHGIRSAYMDYMFLYPLIGGSVLFFILGLLIPGISSVKIFRIGYNLYNSGIATLTLGSLLTGILEIAGTTSVFTTVFTVCGWSFVLVGLIIIFNARLSFRKYIKNNQ